MKTKALVYTKHSLGSHGKWWVWYNGKEYGPFPSKKHAEVSAKFLEGKL